MTNSAIQFPPVVNPRDNGMCQGRITLTSATPVTTGDVTGAGTIYFTPYKGNRIALYNGSVWKVYSFSELSLALTVTSGKNYDVFVYNNAGALTLELSSAWTNDTTRADALALQDGVYVKSGATTRRYLGTIRASGTNTTEDSRAKRFVWNNYNRVRKFGKVTSSVTSWTYGTDAWRAANATSYIVEFVRGLDEDSVDAFVMVEQNGSAGSIGIGLDTATANSAIMYGESQDPTYPSLNMAYYAGFPGLGYHYLQWIERTRTGTTAYYGDAGVPANIQSGLLVNLQS